MSIHPEITHHRSPAVPLITSNQPPRWRSSPLFVDALSVAERNRVLGAVAKDDGALDPGHGVVGLAVVRVRGEGLVAWRVGASSDEVALDAADVGLADNHAVLAWRHPVGEGLRVGCCPSCRGGDRE